MAAEINTNGRLAIPALAGLLVDVCDESLAELIFLKFVNFCHTMLCTHRFIPLCGVRLSVCRIHVLYRNELTYSRTFLPSASLSILVYLYQTLWQYSAGGVECR